jgi:apolipoprotein N-acyltransferase
VHIRHPAWYGLLALLCGAAVPLGFAPFGWFAVPVLSLAVFISLLFNLPSARQALLCGWLYGLGQFGVGVSWVYISINRYGDASLALSLLSMWLLVMYLALFPALMAWLVQRLGAGRRTRLALLTFPAAWTVTEWLRSWVFTGFPWLNLGYSQIDSPLAGFAPLLGVYGIGMLTALSAGLLALAMSTNMRRRNLSLLGLLALWLAGWGSAQHAWTEPAGAALPVALVQGNIPQELKWQPEQQQATLQRYLALTDTEPQARLVVWPETAIPAFYDEVEENFLAPLRERLRARGTALVTGVPVLDRSHWNYYNAVISLEQPGRFYYKVHLVPFGEYLPLRDWLASVLSFLPVPQSDFSAGRLDQPLLQAANYPVGTSICYEIAFGEQLIHTLPEAALLINISNDAWFGDSLAPHQHLEMARMRARETGRYVLRATNTGISAVMDEQGRLVARAPQFEQAVIRAEVVPRQGATPYVYWGNWPVLLLAAGLLLIELGFKPKADR